MVRVFILYILRWILSVIARQWRKEVFG